MKNIIKRTVFLVLSIIITASAVSCDVYGHKHTLVRSEKVEPSCFEPGYTAGEHCTTCNEYDMRQEIPPIGEHTPKEVDEIPATCGTSGLAAGVVCAVCGETLEGRDRVPPTNAHLCKPPTWEWYEDYSGVLAVFECVICTKPASVRLPSSYGTIEELRVPHEVGGEKVEVVRYTATVNFAGMTYTDVQEVFPE